MCLWIQFFFVLALFFDFVGVIPGLTLSDFHHGTFTAEAGSATYTCSCAASVVFTSQRPSTIACGISRTDSQSPFDPPLQGSSFSCPSFERNVSAEAYAVAVPVLPETANPSMPRCAWCGRTWQEVMDTSFRPQTPRSGKSQQNRAHTPPGQGQQPPGQGRQQTLRRRSRKGKKNQGQQNAPPGAAVPLEPAAFPFYTRRAIGRRLRFLVLMLFLMHKGLRRLCSMR